MSKKYFTDIDLNQNELLNVVIERLLLPPSAPVDGQIYFDIVLGKLGQYYSGVWSYWNTSSGGISGSVGHNQVPFGDVSGNLISQPQLYFDPVNHALGIGTSNPVALMHVEGQMSAFPQNNGNARFLMNVDVFNNTSLELHAGHSGSVHGEACYIDFATSDFSDYDFRFITGKDGAYTNNGFEFISANGYPYYFTNSRVGINTGTLSGATFSVVGQTNYANIFKLDDTLGIYKLGTDLMYFQINEPFGQYKLNALGGSGLRMVVTDNNGVLATQAIPASALMVQVEVDFGSTPVSEKEFVVSDILVSGTTKIMANIAYVAPTGKDIDELEMDDLIVYCGKPSVGSFKMFIRTTDGSLVSDKFKVNYQVA